MSMSTDVMPALAPTNVNFGSHFPAHNDKQWQNKTPMTVIDCG
jgi:hypothetical protein